MSVTFDTLSIYTYIHIIFEVHYGSIYMKNSSVYSDHEEIIIHQKNSSHLLHTHARITSISFYRFPGVVSFEVIDTWWTNL